MAFVHIIGVPKEGTNKSFKEIYENLSSKQMNKTVQDLNVEIESITKGIPKLREIWKWKKLGTQTGTSEASLTSRTQETEERISGIEA